MEKAFHGRTMATLSATGSRKVQAGFEPLLSGFVRVPYNDLEALNQVRAANPNIVAVLVEPIQGEGGVNLPDDGYLAALREVCDRNDWLLMLDEVQSGMGRTGRWFAFQHSGIQPDVMTLAKGLANGFPIGACLARGAAAELMIGIELDRPCGELVQQALEAGLLINVTADTVVRLVPPLVLDAARRSC
jgi:acetylornithine/N-succinyldiaminopimelate aminotransferase